MKEDDIKFLHKSGQILASALELSIDMASPGEVALHIEKEITKFILANKAEPSFYGLDGYKFSSCISINEQAVHAIPTRRILRNGDIVTFDIGVKYNGWCTDAARTIVVGEQGTVNKLVVTAKNALDAGILKACAGNRIGDISYAIQKVVELAGYVSPLELGGHGIGRKPHMRPFIANYGRRNTGPIIHSDICLALEPIVMDGARDLIFSDNAIYSSDGGLSSHMEDTIYISESGPVVLTRETLTGGII